MSLDMVKDIAEMHEHYNVHGWVKENPEKLKELLKFRLLMLREEFYEAVDAHSANDAEELVDALLDQVVIALGTLDLMGVDTNKAWDEILRANMSKQVGMKETRKNDLGLPDLIKPSDWVTPNHSDNHGKLTEIFK